MSESEHINFGPAVDTIANNPAKMGTLLIIAEQYPDAIGKTQLAKAFSAVQGDEPGWELGRKNRGAPFSYCEYLIAPTFLDETRINALRGSGTVKAYRLNQRGFNEGVPLSGAGLSWELDYKNTSLVSLLGSSNSWSREERMPSLRVRLYEQLLDAPEGRSQTELYRAVGETVARVTQLVPNLRDAGIITSRERCNPEHRRLTLREPEFARLQRAGPRVLPEVVAIYGLAKELFDQAKTDMSGQEFLDAMRAKYPQFDPKVVWRKVLHPDRLQFIVVAPFEGKEGQQTNYVIAPEYEDSIAALVDSVRKLEMNAEYRATMRERAKDIVTDPDLMADLMGKAEVYSRHTGRATEEQVGVNEQVEPWLQTLVRNIPSEGTDVRSLYERVVSKDNPITFTHFRRLLQRDDGAGYQVVWGEGRGKLRRQIIQVTRQAE